MIRWLEKNRYVSLFFVVLIGGFIFYMSSRTFDGVPGGMSWLSIVYHFSVFFAFGFFIFVFLTKGEFSKEMILLGILICISYGISDEIHQFFVPGRYCCMEDILTNSAGILFSLFVYSFRFDKKIEKADEKIIF